MRPSRRTTARDVGYLGLLRMPSMGPTIAPYWARLGAAPLALERCTRVRPRSVQGTTCILSRTKAKAAAVNYRFIIPKDSRILIWVILYYIYQ